MSKEKNSSYSSMTLSICCSRVGEPCFEVVATIFFFPCERVVRKINFLVWETILLHCFAVVKEVTGGGSRYYLWYPVQVISKSTNNSTRPRIIHNMSPPQVWLAQ